MTTIDTHNQEPSCRVAIIVTHPITALLLLKGQLRHLRSRGFDVILMTAAGQALDIIARREEVAIISVPLTRTISPHQDLRALWHLTRALRLSRPAVVNASTPKAALLGLIAARFAKVPVRVYFVRGLRLETLSGLSRAILWVCERIACTLATSIVAVSPTVMRRLAELRLAARNKMCILGSGSSNGVDTARFTPASLTEKRQRRSGLGIPHDAFVIGFVGRLTRDKGSNDIIKLFRRRPARDYLLIVGDHDEAGVLSTSSRSIVDRHDHIVRAGFQERVEDYYKAMDVLALPSYREGFPNVVLEAAASGLPTVGYQATGSTDAIVDGVTGILTPLGDLDRFSAALDRYAADDSLRERHGTNARERALRDYSSSQMAEYWATYYRQQLARAVAT